VSGLAELGVLAVLLVGLAGVLLPVVPGLLLIWAAGLVWTVADGGGALRWTALAALTALAGAGTATKYVLAGRAARTGGAPRRTLLFGVVGAVAGFFLLPVLGLLIGGVAGIYLAERLRLADPRYAWRSTLAVLQAIGIGVLVELVAAVLMIGVWLGAVAAT